MRNYIRNIDFIKIISYFLVLIFFILIVKLFIINAPNNIISKIAIILLALVSNFLKQYIYCFYKEELPDNKKLLLTSKKIFLTGIFLNTIIVISNPYFYIPLIFIDGILSKTVVYCTTKDDILLELQKVKRVTEWEPDSRFNTLYSDLNERLKKIENLEKQHAMLQPWRARLRVRIELLLLKKETAPLIREYSNLQAEYIKTLSFAGKKLDKLPETEENTELDKTIFFTTLKVNRGGMHYKEENNKVPPGKWDSYINDPKPSTWDSDSRKSSYSEDSEQE